MQWVRLHRPRIYPCLMLFHHVHNEGKRNPKIAHEIGILAGLPDYHLPVCAVDPANRYYNGLWLEIKDRGKEPTKKQLEVMQRLRKYDNFVDWTDNIDQAIDIVKTYCEWVHR